MRAPLGRWTTSLRRLQGSGRQQTAGLAVESLRSANEDPRPLGVLNLPIPDLLTDTLVERANEIARTVLRPEADRVDREGVWPEAGMRALREAGLTGLHVPARLGGHGLGLGALAAITEALGRACTSTAMCFGMHCVATAVLAAKATPEQETRYLEPIARGEHLTTLALSEPGTGAHFYLPRATYEDGSEAFRLNGSKSFVTSGGHADSYVVSAVPPGREFDPGSFTCILVDAKTPGMEWGEPWCGFGMRGNSSRTVLFRDAPVPKDRLIGAEGDELWYVFEVVAPYFLVAMAGSYLGGAATALNLAIEHLKARAYSHTGTRLSENAVLTSEIAEMWTVLERGRQLVRHAARQADAGAPDAMHALFAAKIDVADAATAVVGRAMSVLGGQGYRDHGEIGRILRDVQAAHVMSPTTHILKGWLGRSLLDRPPF